MHAYQVHFRYWPRCHCKSIIPFHLINIIIKTTFVILKKKKKYTLLPNVIQMQDTSYLVNTMTVNNKMSAENLIAIA